MMDISKIEYKEEKIIKVSKKRQITIPMSFYHQLNICDKVRCICEGDCIIIKPVDKLSDMISKEEVIQLIKNGYEGKKLIDQINGEIDVEIFEMPKELFDKVQQLNDFQVQKDKE